MKRVFFLAAILLVPLAVPALTVSIPSGSGIVSNGVHPDAGQDSAVLIEHYPLENAVSFEIDFVTPMDLTFTEGVARYFDDDGNEVLSPNVINVATFDAHTTRFLLSGGGTGAEIKAGARAFFFFPFELLPHNVVPCTIDVELCFQQFEGPNGECNDPLAYRGIEIFEYHAPPGQTYSYLTRDVQGFTWMTEGGHELSEVSHRRGGLRLDTNTGWVNQRYAYDIDLRNGDNWPCITCDQNGMNCMTWENCKNNDEYFCWGQNVHAMADGEIVLLIQGKPDNPEPFCTHPNREDCSGCTSYNPPMPDGTCMFAPGAAECNGFLDVGKCDAPDPSCPLGPDKFPGSGNQVVLLHPNGEYTTYAHMQEGSNDHLVCGQQVFRGDILGQIGMTGSGSYPHIHFSSLTKPGPEDPEVENFPLYFNNLVFLTPGQTVPRLQLDVSLRTGTQILQIRNPPVPIPRNAGLPSGTVQEVEPNDTLPTHNALTLPTVVEGEVETGEVGDLAVRGDGMEDIFRIDLVNPEDLRITLDTLGADHNLDVYAIDEEYRVLNETRQGTNFSGTEHLCLDLDQGSYYVMVSNAQTAPAVPVEYELLVERDSSSIACGVTNVADPIEMDGDCLAVVEFNVKIHDNCCLLEKSLDLQVVPTVSGGIATVGTPVIDSIQQLDERNMLVSGHIEVSGLETCSANIRLDVTATDCTGNSFTTAAPGTACQATVIDGEDPLVIAPPDEVVECDAVPPPGTPTVSDNCDSNPDVQYSFLEIPGNCPGNYTIERTWEAFDNCQNSHSDTQTIDVQDTTPPVITQSLDDAFCLWPPNHNMAGFDASEFSPDISDNCSEPITWEFETCESDQPEDAKDTVAPGVNGDGRTTEDCVVASDGQSFSVRSERAGAGPVAKAGRRYSADITATDACGNTSAKETIGRIHVPHSERGGQTAGCLEPTAAK